MSKLRLDLKVYIDKYGNQYNNGARNILYPIYKLSNNVYRLHLVTERNISDGNVSVFFKKADNSITTAYPMSPIGSEEVDGNLWSVYACDIEDSVLDISEITGNNTLSFSFRQGTTDSNLYSQPVSVKCAYSINGELPTLEATDYDRIMSEILLTFAYRNTDKVFHTTFLPQVIEDNEDDCYNVGYVYILDGKYTAINSLPNTPSENVAYLWTGDTRITEPLLEKDQFYRWKESKWTKLENFKKQIGSGYRVTSGGYRQIIYGLESIDLIKNELLELIDEKDVNVGDKITQILQEITLIKDFINYADPKFAEIQESLNSITASLEQFQTQLNEKSTITWVEWS